MVEFGQKEKEREREGEVCFYKKVARCQWLRSKQRKKKYFHRKVLKVRKWTRAAQ